MILYIIDRKVFGVIFFLFLPFTFFTFLVVYFLCFRRIVIISQFCHIRVCRQGHYEHKCK